MILGKDQITFQSKLAQFARLHEDFVDHTTVDVCQPKISPAVAVGELFVIQPEQVQNGRVQVVQVHFLSTPGRQVIGHAMHQAPFDPAASQPHREPPGVVLPATLFFARFAQR